MSDFRQKYFLVILLAQFQAALIQDTSNSKILSFYTLARCKKLLSSDNFRSKSFYNHQKWLLFLSTSITKTIFAQRMHSEVSGCGSVGRAVAFHFRGPRFDSSHQQNFIEHLFIINCIEKTKKIKRGREWSTFF